MSTQTKLTAITDSALEQLGLREGIRDQNIERIVRMAAHALGAQHAAFSIRQGERQIFLACHNFDEPALEGVDSLCYSVSMLGEPILLNDARRDPIWSNHPALLANPEIRAYASSPIASPDGHPIGALSVWSPNPINLSSPATRRMLADSVRVVEDTLIMRSLMVRDPLTELFNRRYFEQQIEQEWLRARRLQLPLSLAILRIRGFDELKAAYERDVIDDALIYVARHISSKIRRAGDCVCRYADGEFAMFLPMTDSASATRLLQGLCKKIDEQAGLLPEQGAPAELAVRGGIATAYTQDDLSNRSPVAFLSLADRALGRCLETKDSLVRVYEVDPPSGHFIQVGSN